MKGLSFITQFKIEFLLPFTGCRKVLGKMPERIKKNTFVLHKKLSSRVNYHQLPNKCFSQLFSFLTKIKHYVINFSMSHHF